MLTVQLMAMLIPVLVCVIIMVGLYLYCIVYYNFCVVLTVLSLLTK